MIVFTYNNYELCPLIYTAYNGFPVENRSNLMAIVRINNATTKNVTKMLHVVHLYKKSTSRYKINMIHACKFSILLLHTVYYHQDNMNKTK